MISVVRTIDNAILAGAAVGVPLSAISLVYGLSVFPSPMSGGWVIFSEVLLTGLVPIVLLFSSRYRSLMGHSRPGYAGLPPQMRWVAFTLIALGATLFVVSVVLELFEFIPRTADPSGDDLPPTIAGAAGLAAYTAIYAQLYSARMLANTSLERTRER
jgi:hypothetical protein